MNGPTLLVASPIGNEVIERFAVLLLMGQPLVVRVATRQSTAAPTATAA